MAVPVFCCHEIAPDDGRADEYPRCVGSKVFGDIFEGRPAAEHVSHKGQRPPDRLEETEAADLDKGEELYDISARFIGPVYFRRRARAGNRDNAFLFCELHHVFVKIGAYNIRSPGLQRLFRIINAQDRAGPDQRPVRLRLSDCITSSAPGTEKVISMNLIPPSTQAVAA